MADYFTRFSCIFDVGTAENSTAALAIRDQLAGKLDDDEGVSLGFDAQADGNEAPGALWLHSDEDGDPEHVIEFVKLCAEAFDMHGLWGFVWSLSCSKPRLDSFGGGAQVIDLTRRESLDWVDCSHWLNDQLAAAKTPGEEP